MFTLEPFSASVTSPPRRSRLGGGVGVLMLVIVLAIVLVLSMQYFEDDQPVKQVSSGLRDLDRAGAAACATNRQAFKTNLMAYQVSNLGEQFDVAKFRQKYNLPSCARGGGVYLLGPDGEVYCTKHFPPPAEIMQKVIALSTPEPVPTPFASPTPLSAGAPPPAPAAPAITPLPGQ